MRTLDLLRLIWDNLRRQRGRVALTALGVVIGTASIVMLVSLASGLQQSIINQKLKVTLDDGKEVEMGFDEIREESFFDRVRKGK